MSIPVETVCRDIGRPGCLVTPDERYTMCFDDIGEEPIYFCSACGELAQDMVTLLEHAIKTRGQEFVDQLSDQITKAEQENARSKS